MIICMELTLHSMVEEESFYPALARTTGDESNSSSVPARSISTSRS